MPSPFRTVLCTTDLSEPGNQAVSLAFALAAEGGLVHVLHVIEPLLMPSPLEGVPMLAAPPPAAEMAEQAERAEQALSRLVPAASAARGVRAKLHVMHELGVSGLIQRRAADLGAEVIVMATHGRSGLSRLLQGSVATAVMKESALPVVLLRPAIHKAKR